ncbi:MAG: hypothetical protein P4L84_11265 [Isosphaeraceae bacterium]|nr:hypothetical protein [Isosphaeraceae bacterium]
MFDSSGLSWQGPGAPFGLVVDDGTGSGDCGNAPVENVMALEMLGEMVQKRFGPPAVNEERIAILESHTHD